MPSTASRRPGGQTAPPPAAEAWSLVFAMFWARRDTFVSIAEAAGLRPADMKALLMLEQPLPMREVAERVACDPSTLTGVVDRLEAAGYVERRPDRDDRRIKMVALTTAGERARSDVMARLSVPPEELLRLSVAEQRTLRDLLRKAVTPPE